MIDEMNFDEYQDELEQQTKGKGKPPKPRKHLYLWQSYLWYVEFLELRKKHTLRISAIERGSSSMSAEFEREWIVSTQLDKHKNDFGKILTNNANLVGPIWQWLRSIRGLNSGLLTAQLVAQIDDIGNFDTISKLWRFCGYAVFNGKAEPKSSFKAPHDDDTGRHYNGRLKGVCYNIAQTFIKMQTPGYIDIYYAEKARQRELHPVAICRKCKIECSVKTKKIKGEEVQIFSCPNNPDHVKDFSKEHINYRAIRKMMKAFLKDLWLEWRRLEGLDISEEWKG
jgi:hypothetical protein